MKRGFAPDFFRCDEEIKRRKADDTGAPSSSATPKGSNSYDVFLSFRGADTRKTFVDHLYNNLVDAGIRVFKDDDGLREGEEIDTNLLAAIKNSKISIPVLSQNYASSKWCLQELVQMIECMKSAGQVVLPIFYRVEPADVRHQKGSFREAFSHLRGKYSEEDVAKWKEALQEVASLKGWESEKIANSREGELVRIVVRIVLSKLKEAFQLVVTEQLVGIDDTVADILRLLDDNPNAIQIVGIHGMGGIGKTTSAKVVYNKLSDHFQHRSFIADIRESSQLKGISCLQEQLIHDILGTKDRVWNEDEGIRIMESRFKREKVLILLDDVDNHNQLKALIGKHDWFKRGSRIIITTRNKSILDHAKLNYQYELKRMAKDQSLILFSRHAFWRDSPPHEFESLSHDVVSTAGGLPLCLEVIGSFLCAKNISFWRDALKRLKKVPHEDVQKKLRISYDALSYEDKQIFLDIACFFIGTDLRIASYVWDDYEFYPSMGIETLRLMSLIKIGDNYELKMHDQLRDLGTEIVRQEDYNAPMNRSRVWFHEEALEVLQRNRGIEKLRVRALRLDNCSSNTEFTAKQFEELPNLRFLQVRAGILIGDSKSLLPELRWLGWNWHIASVATRFHPEKLIVLDLSWSKISEFWEGWSQFKVAKELKVLNLKGCKCLKGTPDLSAFQKLKILVLANCDNLEQIHHSIGEARTLVSLDFSQCVLLQLLPQEMGKLEELKELDISGTAIEEIPKCLASLKKLEILHAHGCKALVEPPDSISYLVNLLELDLSGCINLYRLPKDIGSLVKLQRLFLGGVGTESRGSTFIERIRNVRPKLKLTQKKVISDSDRPKQKEKISDSDRPKQKKQSQTQDLILNKFSHGPRVRTRQPVLIDSPFLGIGKLLESVGDLNNLKVLDITESELIFFPSSMSKLGNLEELHASHTSLMEKVPINGLSSLKILILSHTDIYGFSDKFDELSRLEKLDLRSCRMLQSLPKSMSKLRSLQHLRLIDCHRLQSLPELPGYLTILEVTCQHCTLPQLSHLIHLRELTVSKCKLLESMPDLPSAILKLSIYGCDELKEFPSLSSLKLLSQLEIQNCWELTKIKGLEALKSLRHLSVSGSKKLSKFDGLEHAESLRYLDMSSSSVNEDLVQGLGRLKNLEELDISGCEYLIRPKLSQLVYLKRLHVQYCHHLVKIEGLERLKKLEWLDIQRCTSIETLPSLSCFDNLKYLCILHCPKLREVEGQEKVQRVYK
ncbi:hypothetical protein ACJRO7_013502 [Eucalyptus globulus]|uniref:TIR domain-containing protein n=1 Tax=Eucalyptus globulus TaxID=34317 RepID=A0ABD3L0Y6_EUCGL